MTLDRLARAVGDDARREPAPGQRAGRRHLDPGLREHRLGEQRERELADRAGRGQRRRQHDLGASADRRLAIAAGAGRARALRRREQPRRAARERDQQADERVAVCVAQARQHPAPELAPLRTRRQRLRQLEQRDRGARRRHPVEVGEHPVGERDPGREQQLVGRQPLERRGLALGELREHGEPGARGTTPLAQVIHLVKVRERRQVGPARPHRDDLTRVTRSALRTRTGFGESLPVTRRRGRAAGG